MNWEVELSREIIQVHKVKLSFQTLVGLISLQVVKSKLFGMIKKTLLNFENLEK